MTNFAIYVKRMEIERKQRKEREVNARLLNGLQTKSKGETWDLLTALCGRLARSSSVSLKSVELKA
jgi:hypothetical protein